MKGWYKGGRWSVSCYSSNDPPGFFDITFQVFDITFQGLHKHIKPRCSPKRSSLSSPFPLPRPQRQRPESMAAPRRSVVGVRLFSIDPSSFSSAYSILLSSTNPPPPQPPTTSRKQLRRVRDQDQEHRLRRRALERSVWGWIALWVLIVGSLFGRY